MIILNYRPAVSACLTGLSQFGVTLGEYLLGPPIKFIQRRNIPDGAMQTFGIIVMNIIRHNPAGLFQRQGRLRANALTFDALMPPFDFSVALGIVRARPDMRHTTDANEVFEIPGDKGRAVI